MEARDAKANLIPYIGLILLAEFAAPGGLPISRIFMTQARKLAAILVSDVVGFSRMAGADEDYVLGRLRALRGEVIDPIVAGHNGRVVKGTGDGVIVEFRSAVEAVACALAIQGQVAERDADQSEERAIRLRIGIHVGDVVEESDGDLMGDGVNIAARLEGVSEPGGLAVSEDTFRQVRARPEFSFVDRGPMRLKNIVEPIRVYAARMARTRMVPRTPSAPTKPSVAVLPFQNLSADPEQAYFADGIAEDVITDLSAVGGLTVIARASSFAYREKAMDVRMIARELGVGAVLEGSVRRAGDRVRITAQLVDCESGTQVWAERFDRDLKDVFAVQDEVARRIVKTLRVKLTPRDAERLDAARATSAGKAHDLVLIGRSIWWEQRRDADTFARAMSIFGRAVKEDPDCAEAHAGLSMWENQNWISRWTPDWREALNRARVHIEVAIGKGPNLAYVRRSASSHFFWRKDLDRAAAEADAALDLSPNYAEAHNMRGMVYVYGGNPLAGVPNMKQAMRLDPVTRQAYLHFLGTAYLVAGRYEQAEETFRERIALSPRTDLSRALLAVTLGRLGRPEEAQAVWRELMQINPKYVFEDHVDRLPFRNPEDPECLREGARLAGVPL